MAKKKSYSTAFKARVALEAISGEKTLALLDSERGVRQNLVGKWKKQLVDAAAKT